MYKHTSPSKKIYIGITSKEPTQRWRNGYGYYSQTYFYNAIQKYGWDNIQHEVLYNNLTEYEAKAKEIEMIKKYKSNNKLYGYNQTNGGDGTVGFKMPKESIEKSNKTRYKKVYQYDMECNFIKLWDSIKLAATTLGISDTSISACCLGKTNTSHGYIWSHKELKNTKPIKITRGKYIYQYDLNGKYIKTWNNAGEIERELKCKATNITGCCNGSLRYAYGYIWRYEKTDKIQPITNKSVHQYSLDGKYINSFDNQNEANSALGYKHLPIGAVCRGERRQAGGYLWSFEKKDFVYPVAKERRFNNKNSIHVNQYTCDGKLIKSWISTAEIHRVLGYTSKIISDCCHNKRGDAYGFKWAYTKSEVIAS